MPAAADGADERRAAHIDIRLPSGVVISVGSDVEVEALRRVLTALAGR